MRLIKKIVGLFGYDLINKKKQLTLDAHLLRVINSLDINVVLDVGANIGVYGKKLRKMGYKGIIISFEPVSSVYNLLKLCTAKDTHWIACHYALGTEEKTMEINVFPDSSLSSFKNPNAYGASQFSLNPDIVKIETVQVKTLAQVLPNLLASHSIAQPRIFLKMDTQGYDAEVIKGCGNQLSSILGIQSEISLKPIYDNMLDYKKSLELYENLGFEISGLYPVSRDKKTLAIIEIDCVLLRHSTYPNLEFQ
jgi:FkbM family methyltransferase